ncbi:hypothetical protein QLQ12_34255 [Actinoplanes sp. NEAU-A12]|uniref:Uncharacterized protein n=1 Tax=Actinoplanes sandaracinus TaxID=3045177 RepID=A0ABT6WVB7_9ACTN|nr:hypothetical protein [Actinoplanes sandaracinus]MDI6103689.1 hypothetical protein [Actinoplanes sandaracinus]
MRRMRVLACAAVALLTTAAAGTAVGGDVARGVPAPAASPPLGDDYFTSSEMERGLPAVADLPAGYTVADGSTDVGFATSNPCSFMPSDFPNNTTVVSRTYAHRSGARLTIDIVASGSTSARETVASTAAVPRTCPTVTDIDDIRRNSPLPVPSLGDASAGMISVTESPHHPPQRRYSAVVALGDVYVGFVETDGDQARFIEVVKAGTRTADKVDDPPSATDLERALMTTADLPAGYRPADDSVENTRDFFTETKCDGTPVDYGTPATFVHRTFTKGSGGPTIRVAVGTAERAVDLIGAISSRQGTCGTDTELRLPSTDLTTRAGIVYPGLPVRARAIFVYRDVFTQILATTPDLTGIPEIEKIIEKGWLSKVFDVYYPDSPERQRLHAWGLSAPATSPPPAGEYYTSVELERGLPAAADLPAGYTVAPDDDELGRFSPCDFLPAAFPDDATIASRTFTHRGGTQLTIVIVAAGSASAREAVARTAAIPTTCPDVSQMYQWRTNTRLPLPALGDASAGVVSVTESPHDFTTRIYSAVVAYGDVYVGFVETGGDQARFVKAVEAGVRTARKIDGPKRYGRR